MSTKYSDDELLGELRAFAEELGRTPTMTEMNEQGPYSAQTYYHRFGSWTDALQEAGVEIDNDNARTSLSKEELCEALQDLTDELGRTPKTTEMEEQGPYSTSTYFARFGSWSNALEAADLDGDRGRGPGGVISRKELLTALQDLADELGETPTVAEMNEQGRYAVSTYIERFGSWNDAVREAGLSTNDETKGVSKEELLAALQDLADELGRAPTQREMRQEGQYSTTTYQTHFGSWSEAIKAAGCETGTLGRRVSREKLLTALQDLANELGRPPTTTDMREHGPHSQSPYFDRFGSWSDALQEAGLEAYYEQTHPSKKELRKELQDLADELGQTPTHQDITKQSTYSAYAYRDRFGTWNNALKAAGLELSHEQRPPSMKELRKELQDLADELGRAPNTTEMAEQGPYSTSPYYNRFGSWDDALEAAGLKANQSRPPTISKEELLTALQELADELGGTPTNDQMDAQGPHSATTYRERFGSWNSAVREAGLEVNYEATRANKEELLTALQELAGELGRTPTVNEMEEQSPYSEWIYRDRFGTWNDALEAAGLLDTAP